MTLRICLKPPGFLGLGFNSHSRAVQGLRVLIPVVMDRGEREEESNERKGKMID